MKVSTTTKLILTLNPHSGRWPDVVSCHICMDWMPKAEIVQSPILVTDTCVIFFGGMLENFSSLSAGPIVTVVAKMTTS